MYPGSWNNRQVTWQFESAPNYTGDINIGAIQGAQPYWAAIAISHLPNGIHGVQYFANGAWASATMDSDQGDDYIISPTTGAGTGGSQYEIRVIDASGNLVNNGEVYNFSLPAACVPNGCTAAYTPIGYTTSTSPSPTPSPSTSASSSPTPSPSTSASSPGGTGACALTSTVTNSWPGGYQLQLTVANNGTTPLTGWTAGFKFGDTAETIASSWNATVTQSGKQVSAVNASYDGSVAAAGSITFGMVVNGSNQALSGLTCSAA
jgi:hypothetical protein